MSNKIKFCRGQAVWILLEGEYVFRKARVLDQDRAGVCVTFGDDRSERNGVWTSPRSLFFRDDDMLESGDVEQVTDLLFLNDAEVMNVISSRVQSGVSEVCFGPSLVMVNCFVPSPPFSSTTLDPPLTSTLLTNMAQQITSTILTAKKSVNIIFGGVSGSGKTYSASRLISTLAVFGQASPLLVKQLRAVDVVCASFCGARLAENSCSSRILRLTRLIYGVGNASGDIIITGAHVTSMCFDWRRVANSPVNQRNFNVFYQLVQGAAGSDRQKYGLRPSMKVDYLSTANDVSDPLYDLRGFQELISSFHTLGIAAAEIDTILKTVTAILLLGNLKFVKDAKSNNTIIQNTDVLLSIARLLDIKADCLASSLCYRCVVVSNSQQPILSPLTAAESKSNRDVLACSIYRCVVTSVFGLMNRTLNGSSAGMKSSDLMVSVIDPAGFESLEPFLGRIHNSFYQWMINYIDDRLLQVANELIRDGCNAMEEGRGIITHAFDDDSDPVDATNDTFKAMLLCEERMGLFDILDESSRNPRGSDAAFISTLRKDYPDLKNDSGDISPTSFTMPHVRGPVTYESNGFVLVNEGLVPVEIQNIIENSNSFLKSGFKEFILENRFYGDRDGTTICEGLRARCEWLINKVVRAANVVTFVVPCIRGNRGAVAGKIEIDFVLNQLSGSLLTRHVYFKRLPIRMSLLRFYKHYWFVDERKNHLPDNQRVCIHSSPDVLKTQCVSIMSRPRHSNATLNDWRMIMPENGDASRALICLTEAQYSAIEMERRLLMMKHGKILTKNIRGYQWRRTQRSLRDNSRILALTIRGALSRIQFHRLSIASRLGISAGVSETNRIRSFVDRHLPADISDVSRYIVDVAWHFFRHRIRFVSSSDGQEKLVHDLWTVMIGRNESLLKVDDILALKDIFNFFETSVKGPGYLLRWHVLGDNEGVDYNEFMRFMKCWHSHVTCWFYYHNDWWRLLSGHEDNSSSSAMVSLGSLLDSFNDVDSVIFQRANLGLITKSDIQHLVSASDLCSTDMLSAANVADMLVKWVDILNWRDQYVTYFDSMMEKSERNIRSNSDITTTAIDIGDHESEMTQTTDINESSNTFFNHASSVVVMEHFPIVNDPFGLHGLFHVPNSVFLNDGSKERLFCGFVAATQVGCGPLEYLDMATRVAEWLSFELRLLISFRKVASGKLSIPFTVDVAWDVCEWLGIDSAIRRVWVMDLSKKRNNLKNINEIDFRCLLWPQYIASSLQTSLSKFSNSHGSMVKGSLTLTELRAHMPAMIDLLSVGRLGGASLVSSLSFIQFLEKKAENGVLSAKDLLDAALYQHHQSFTSMRVLNIFQRMEKQARVTAQQLFDIANKEKLEQSYYKSSASTLNSISKAEHLVLLLKTYKGFILCDDLSIVLPSLCLELGFGCITLIDLRNAWTRAKKSSIELEASRTGVTGPAFIHYDIVRRHDFLHLFLDLSQVVNQTRNLHRMFISLGVDKEGVLSLQRFRNIFADDIVLPLSSADRLSVDLGYLLSEDMERFLDLELRIEHPIDWEEFQRIIWRWQEFSKRITRLRELFDFMDDGGSGEISTLTMHESFNEVWAELGFEGRISEEDIVDILSVLDSDNNETLSWNEFQRFFSMWQELRDLKHRIQDLWTQLDRGRHGRVSLEAIRDRLTSDIRSLVETDNPFDVIECVLSLLHVRLQGRVLVTKDGFFDALIYWWKQQASSQDISSSEYRVVLSAPERTRKERLLLDKLHALLTNAGELKDSVSLQYLFFSDGAISHGLSYWSIFHGSQFLEMLESHRHDVIMKDKFVSILTQIRRIKRAGWMEAL